MVLTFRNFIMVILLCLTFVGQTLATTVMPYNMVNMKSMAEHQQPKTLQVMKSIGTNCHEMSDDRVMTPEDISPSQQENSSCCAQSCHCLSGSCTNFLVLIKNSINRLTVDYSSKITSIYGLKKSQVLTSLFKPPIIS